MLWPQSSSANLQSPASHTRVASMSPGTAGRRASEAGVLCQPSSPEPRFPLSGQPSLRVLTSLLPCVLGAWHTAGFGRKDLFVNAVDLVASLEGLPM